MEQTLTWHKTEYVIFNNIRLSSIKIGHFRMSNEEVAVMTMTSPESLHLRQFPHANCGTDFELEFILSPLKSFQKCSLF